MRDQNDEQLNLQYNPLIVMDHRYFPIHFIYKFILKLNMKYAVNIISNNNSN